MSGQASALGGYVVVEYVSDLLGAVVDDFDTDMRLICREGCAESFLLTLREPITRGAQEIADLIQGIASASTVAQCVLVDATEYLTWGVAGELNDVKGIQHAGGVLELVINDVLISLEGIQPPIRTPARKSFPRSASQFLYAVPDLPGTRSTQAGRGMILPAC